VIIVYEGLTPNGYKKLRKALWKRWKAGMIDEVTYYRKLNDLKTRYLNEQKRRRCEHKFDLVSNVKGELIEKCVYCGYYINKLKRKRRWKLNGDKRDV
jgi:hypothetical protein